LARISSKVSAVYPALLNTGLHCSDAALYQGPNALDSILNYPMYTALLNAFTIPGQQNTSAVTDMIAQEAAKFKVCGPHLSVNAPQCL
jgi:hypothetical protein